MAEELNLIISNPGENEFLQRIIWNKDEFMELVASITEQYQGLTYTEEDMKLAKSDRAKLNAMKKAISDRRIEVKKVIMAPYTQFEEEVKEIVALIEKPITMIDSQIKDYEERSKAEKKASLEEHFAEKVEDLKEVLVFDRIFDSKWLNANVSLKKAKEEIEDKLDCIRKDLESVDSLCEEKYKPQMKDFYMRNLDIRKTLEECSRLKEIDRREAERKEREAEAARLREEQEAERKTAIVKTEESVSETAEIVSKPIESVSEQSETVSKQVESDTAPSVGEAEVKDPFASNEEEKQYKASFTVYGTKEQIMALKQYMIINNIKFGKVEK